MNKRITLLAMAFCLLFNIVNAQQISVTTLSQVYTQDFNSLANTGSTGTSVPNGWYYNVANYRVGNGASNSGGLYSFGDLVDSVDRSLGSLGSSSATPSFGVKFVNSTSSSITSITLSFTTEQWRLGQKPALRIDSTVFSYNVDVDSLNATGWTRFSGANLYTADTTNSTSGALNGNVAPNRTSVNTTINGLAISPGSTFWLKWSEINVSGTDDGLAIDDLSVSFSGAVLPACTEPANSVTNVVLNATGINSVAGSFTATTPASDGYLVLLDTTGVAPTITDATTYNVGNTVGSAIVVSNGISTSFTRSGLVTNTIYKAYVYPYNNASCTGGPNYNTTAPGNDTAKTLIDACPEPTGIVTNLVFTDVTNTTLTGKFNKAVGAAGYVVLYGTSSTLPAVRDSADYTVGQTITQGANTATVGYFGTDSNFTLTGLTAGTKYYAVVFPYTTCTFGKNYKINFTNDVNKQDTTTTGGVVACPAPDTIVSITVGTVTTNSISGSFVPPTPNAADSFLVIYRKSNFLVLPRDSVHYQVGGFYTAVSGTYTDTSFVAQVLPGNATTFTISGLDNNTKYYFAVIPFKACSGYPNYNLKLSFASNKASATTGAGASCPAPDTIVSITVGTISSNSISGSFVPPSPNAADSFLVIYRKSNFLVLPRDSVHYQVGGFYTAVSGTYTDTSYVAQVLPGNATTFTISGLDNNTKYYFAIIPFKACSGYPNYNLKLSFASNKASATTQTSTGVKIKSNEVDFAVYPNPTNTGALFVKFNNNLKEEAVIEVIDILGQKLAAQKVAAGTTQQTIDVSNFAKGTYILNVLYKGDNNVSTFIVQ